MCILLFKKIKAQHPSQLKQPRQKRNPWIGTVTLLRRIFLHLIICTGWCLPSSLHSPVTWQHLGQWRRSLCALVRVRVALLSGNQYLLFSVSGLFKKEPEASMLDAVLWQRHCSSVLAGSTRRWCSSTTTAAVPMKWARTWRVLLVATLLRTSVGIWWRTPRPWHPARLTRPATCPPPVWANQWSSAARALQLRIHPARPCHMGTSVAAITRAECRITAALSPAERSPPPRMERNTWTRPPRATTSPLEQRNSLFIRPTLQVHTNLSPVTWTFLWCQLSVRRQRPDMSPCCLWRPINRGLSPPTAGTARFTAPRSSPSLDTCGSPPYQVGYFPQSPAFAGQGCLTC